MNLDLYIQYTLNPKSLAAICSHKLYNLRFADSSRVSTQEQEF